MDSTIAYLRCNCAPHIRVLRKLERTNIRVEVSRRLAEALLEALQERNELLGCPTPAIEIRELRFLNYPLVVVDVQGHYARVICDEDSTKEATCRRARRSDTGRWWFYKE